MFDIRAFLDESGTEHEVLCLAGYWALAGVWEKFDEAWNARLQVSG